MTPIVLAFVDVPQKRPPESSENCFLKLRSSFDGEYFDVFIFFCRVSPTISHMVAITIERCG